MLTNFDRFSGFNKSSTVPAGSLLNASSDGAKTVNGPTLPSVSASPASVAAVSNVLKVPAFVATVGIESDAGMRTLSMT